MTASASDGGAMLSGIKVLDLTSVVFGPYCTQILADLGAEVTKVEPPEIGDVARYLGKPAVSAGMSPTFMALNGGKQSRAIDLKSEAGAAQMQALLAECDVFVLNVRGKAAERLGLDYESVRAINPQVIYVHCVGFGQEGPYADLQAYDDVIQAATGATTLASRVDGDPRARYIPSLIADKVAGLHAAYGVLAAVIHKLRTGEGQRIEVPMFEAFAQFLLVEHLGGLTFDPPNAPVCYFRQIDPDRQPFPTSDGYISIVAYTASAWPRLFAALDAPEVLEDERFATSEGRMAHLPELYRTLATLTPRFTSEELAARCHAAQIPAQPARDIGEIRGDPHLAATGFFTRREHPTEGAYLEMAQPVRFSARPFEPRPFPRKLGEDNPPE
ncbi:CaiB/BaiF CoA transferase family protein [Novosphingobium tardum]|uniref:CaiB/BaiF CoA transferase family protein n=1 Tax=Novosphingobium tardum TaxID=1538021 RepID=A0ABV8RKF6_9SPHN